MPTIPEHIPQNLVGSFDYIRDPRLQKCPWTTLTEVARDNPDIFWSTELGGHWVVTRKDYIYEIMCNTADFSNIPAMIGPSRFPVRLIPTEMDPPEHGKYRAVLSAYFSPKAINVMRPKIIKVCEQLIDEFKAKGQCEFVKDIAQQIPTMIFAEMMGVPYSEVPMYLRWVHDYLHNPDVEAARRTGNEIHEYLKNMIEKRKTEPANDLITVLLNGEIDGQTMSDDDVFDYAFLVFTGGLDTLIAVMGYAFRYLAEHPELRHQLREEPELIRTTAIEMFRRFSVVSRARHTTRDLDFKGVTMKQGDAILVAGGFASLDPNVFVDPLDVKPDRRPNAHGAFSYGPHRCLGAFLAEAEMEELIRAWLREIPEFEVAPGTEFTHYTGIFGLPHLPLRWRLRT